jgi:S1-C subfamily serine protease
MYHVPDEQLGRHVRCQQCQHAFLVVSAAASTPGTSGHSEASFHLPAIILIAVIALGLLAVVGTAGVVAWYTFEGQETRQSAQTVDSLRNRHPTKRPGPPTLQLDSDLTPATATEQMAFEPRRFEEPDDGRRTFFPETPLLGSTAADPQAPSLAPDGTLDPAVLKHVKAATALLRVTTAEGMTPEGSGFLCGEAGLLVTNCHVVGMLAPGAQKPRQVQVIIHSGEPGERALTATVLAVDRAADLAVLRVDGDDLPAALKVAATHTLRETMPVFVSGFPGGSIRGRNVAVTPTRIDSLLKEKGVLSRVQVRGAMLPGNSGGPVVNAHGQVIGVSVSGLILPSVGNTGVNFAVPSDKVLELLHGRVEKLTVSYPRSDGLANVRLHLFDPRGQIAEAALEWWIGDLGNNRPPAWTPPEKLATDGERRRETLHDGAARIRFPALPEGKCYWLQLVLQASGSSQKRWTSAVTYRPPAALEAVPLAFNLKTPPSANVELATKAALTLRGQHGQVSSLEFNVGAAFKEEEGRLGRLADFELGVRFHGENVQRDFLRQLTGRRSQTASTYSRQVPDRYRHEANLLVESLAALIEALGVLHRDKAVQPLETWSEQGTLPLDALIAPEFHQPFQLTFTYLGTTTSAGQRRAVLEMQGESVKAEHAQATARFTGMLWLDPETGLARLTRAEVEYAIEGVPFANDTATIEGKTLVKLVRSVP